jgi:hypothetical protein
VARLWDTDSYNGSNPDITAQTSPAGATVGLAEVTSANFFSQRTISKVTGADPVLPYPAIDQLVPGPTETLPSGNLRRYWSKNGPGIPITHMAFESAFNLFVPSTWQRFQLDDKVFQDYAAALLPRAIGYSAGLIDYFFRGRISGLVTTPWENFNETQTTQIQFTFLNEDPNETAGTGMIVLVIAMRDLNTNAIIYFKSQPRSVTPTPEPQTVTMDFSNNPIPNFIYAIASGTIVFRGLIG